MNAALLDDGENGSDEVLVGPHPARDTVHDDAEFNGHFVLFDVTGCITIL
jgi:hypothetical protein